MPIHAVTYTYTDDDARRDAVRPEHREFLGALAARGVVVASGPLAAQGDTPAGALLLLDAVLAPDALEALDADPFHREGLVAAREVRSWSPVIGALREHA
ncbi:hypothetical protein CLV28_1810 [Sediminihabitans luteus]|uniref:YCII-related domain-containing protein n=1 Tax=Sediminihabitans luteus TaxID=1138585 RepID=A0A2M9CR53_9CELL|nr:YciI family protein [Sediminihabitans luteus]PJJ74315.1 hypothetical protein CLV28_1810 [Sediminihabitans luteus]GII99168.1 hypothetical protein Slu03_15460 [Sediminihabitans luteus]